jgi:hemoglobin
MTSIYEELGEVTIRKIAHLFYKGVEEDTLMRPMYPKDLAPAEERFALFLIQFFGGPTTYSDQRGHPRLKMRHFPYAIDFDAREHWMKHIANAMHQIEVDEFTRSQMMQYFENASLHMINRS